MTRGCSATLHPPLCPKRPPRPLLKGAFRTLASPWTQPPGTTAEQFFWKNEIFQRVRVLGSCVVVQNCGAAAQFPPPSKAQGQFHH